MGGCPKLLCATGPWKGIIEVKTHTGSWTPGSARQPMAHPEEGHKHGQRDKMTRLTDCKARTETSASQEAGLVMRELKGGFPSFLGSRWEFFEGSSQLVSAENPIPHQKFCHLKTWTHMTHFHPMGWTVTISPEAPRMAREELDVWEPCSH